MADYKGYIFDKEQEEKVVAHFRDIISGLKTTHDEFHANNAEWWQRHLGEYSAKKDKDAPFVGCADLRTKIIQYSDSAIEARFNAGLNSVQFAKITAGTAEGRDAAKATEDFINNFWKRESGVIDVILRWFQMIVVEGTGFLKILPAQKGKTVKRYSIMSQLKDKVKELVGYKVDSSTSELATEIKEVQKHIGAKWDTVKMDDLRFYNDVACFEDVIAQKVYLTRKEIKSKKGIWKNVDELLKKYEDKKDKIASPTVISETDDVKNDHSGTSENIDNLRIPVWECWSGYEVGGEDKESYFVFSDEHWLYLYGGENRFFDTRKPYIYAPCYRIADKVVGQGLPQRLADSNDAADILLDQAVDNNSLANTLNFLYVPNKSFDLSKIKFQNGKGIPVGAIEGAFRELKFSSSVGEISALYGIVNGIAERLSLVADYSLGRESAANRNATASGTAMLLQQFAITLDPLIRNIQEALSKAMYQTLQCLYEYMPAEGIKYTVGEEEKVFKRQYLEYLDEFNIAMLSGAIDVIVQKETQVAQALLSTFGADESGEVDTYKLKQNFIRTLAPHLETELMRTPQEVQMIQAIQAKAQQLAELEKVLVAKAQELDQAKSQVMIDRGMEEENKLIAELDAAGITGEKREAALKKFRRGYMDMEATNA